MNSMRLYSLICIFLGLFFIGKMVFAAPPPIYRPTEEEITKAAAPCLRVPQGLPINDKYTCPVGNYSKGNNLSLSKERVECSIQIALSLEAIDKKTELWLKQLQSSRDTDINKWILDIETKTKTAEDSFEKQYEQVCSLTGWTIAINGKGLGCAKTTDFFPETACKGIVSSKISALQNMGFILASKGIAKNFQNEKDKHLDKTKGAYSLIEKKWNQYLIAISRAVQKFNGYIKKTVQ